MGGNTHPWDQPTVKSWHTALHRLPPPSTAVHRLPPPSPAFRRPSPPEDAFDRRVPYEKRPPIRLLLDDLAGRLACAVPGLGLDLDEHRFGAALRGLQGGRELER